MDTQNFFNTLPSNNFYKFDDVNLFLEFYSGFYPTEEERLRIYMEEDYRNEYLHPKYQ
jgi:hypothetical protein